MSHPIPTAPASTDKSEAWPHHRVLLVEDDPVYAQLVMQVLHASSLAPITVENCATLQAAGEAGARTRFEAALLDLDLPDSDGIDTVRTFRARFPRLPFVVVTNSNDESMAVRAIQAGAQDYLFKQEIDSRLLARVLRHAMERKRGEEAFREREQFFRLISENVSDLVSVINADGRRLYNSPSFSVLFGEEVLAPGRDAFLEIHPDDRDRVRQIFHQILASGIGQTAEFRLVRPDGTVRLVESRGSAVRDEEGRPAQVVVVSRDITDRRRAEEELREREEFFRLITENVTDMIAVVDAKGRRLYNSRSYRHIFGDPEAMRGTNSFAEIHPEDRERIKAVFEETVRSGQGQRTEFRFVLPSGEVRLVESIGTVIRDRANQVSKVVIVSRDISDRKRAEDALGQSERRYRRLLSSTTDYIFTVKVEGGQPVSTTHGLGCEAVTGYTPEEYASDPHLWFRMVDAVDREAVLAQARQVLAGETPPPLEHRLVHKDGTVRWVKHTTVPQKDGSGRLISYDGLISDITARKEYEARLRDANAELQRSEDSLRLALADLQRSHAELQTAQLHLIQAEKMESVGTLAAGVAHEVKNPLQVILMGLRYLATQFRGANDDVRQTIDDMRTAVSRADRIVRSLLEFSASHQLDMQDESLAEVVAQSLQLARYEIEKAGVKVTRQIEPSLPPLRLDRIKMEQVIINLLINAVHAMPNGGDITLRAGMRAVRELPVPPRLRESSAFAGKETTVALEIEDTGGGIPEEALRRIFDPFYTTKPAGQGTGLGLTVVRNIVEWHGGHVDVSNRPGGGVRVTLIFNPETIQRHERQETHPDRR